jgi:hypothetical protein
MIATMINRKIVLLLALLTGWMTYAQPGEEPKEEEKLNNESVTVVKPYSPTISDAFKVKSVPQINDTTQLQKKPITYRINSVPVASTFTPAQGRLSRLKRPARPEYFDNYAKLGLGNYTNVLAEFAGNIEIDRESDFGVFLNHFSSQGGIDEAVLDDAFHDTSLDLSYGRRSRDMSWSIGIGGRQRSLNWYGVPISPFTVNLEPDDLNAEINYLHYGAGTSLEFYDSVVEDVEVKFDGLTTDYDASEIQAGLQVDLAFPVMEEEVSFEAQLDYLTGTFEEEVSSSYLPEYSYLNNHLSPSINLYGNNYALSLGARLNYLLDLENSSSEFNVYPDIEASYRLLDDKVAVFTTIGGGLDLNSYRELSLDNPFLAPSVLVLPTDRVIDAQIGVKGNLTTMFGYKVYGGYRFDEGRALFLKNDFVSVPTDREAYEWENSFIAYYTDVTTFNAGASVSFDLNENLNVVLDGQYFGYNVDDAAINDTASQLPEYKVDLMANYQITDSWRAGMMFYVIGEREVFYANSLESTTRSLDAFADLNLDVSYNINEHLSAFVRGNNLLGNSYEYFADFPVQGLQVMGGAVYKFNF